MDEYTIHIEPENVTPIHEINLVLTSVKVECESRKLRTEWTPTVLDDLRYYEPINASSVLDQVIAEVKFKQRIKHQKRKERRAYIKEIENWIGQKIRRFTKK